MIYWICSARALACIAVVLLHISAGFVGGGAFKNLPRADWMLGNVIDSATRWAVPVFIIVSGALLIKKDFDLKYFCKRRILKVVVPFITWSVIYCAYTASTNFFHPQNLSFSLPKFLASVHNLPGVAAYFHLSFFYYFIPLYFFVPFMFPVLNLIGRERGMFVFVVLAFVTSFPVLGIYTLSVSDMNVFVLYMIAGYYFFNGALAGWDKYSPLVLILSVSFIALGTYYKSVAQGSLCQVYYTYTVLPVFLSAFAVLGFSRKYLDKKIRLLKLISDNSLGIYLIHPLVLAFAEVRLPWMDGYGVVPAIVMKLVLAMSVSLAVSASLSAGRFTRWMVP